VRVRPSESRNVEATATTSNGNAKLGYPVRSRSSRPNAAQNGHQLGRFTLVRHETPGCGTAGGPSLASFVRSSSGRPPDRTFGYSDTWQLVIKTGTTIVTSSWYFLMRHQTRDTMALQIKLAELIHRGFMVRKTDRRWPDMLRETCRALPRGVRTLCKPLEIFVAMLAAASVSCTMNRDDQFGELDLQAPSLRSGCLNQDTMRK